LVVDSWSVGVLHSLFLAYQLCHPAVEPSSPVK
jgi:hypothetical protein